MTLLKDNKMNFPTNENIYIDANFLIAYFVEDHKDHKNSKKLLAYLLNRNNSLHFSPLTIDELIMGIHKIKNQTEIKKGNKKGYSVSYFYTELKLALGYLLGHAQFKLRQFENDLNNSCLFALENVKEFILRPRDAFHVSYMQDWSINKIISKDSSFDKLKNINIKKIDF